MKKIYVVGGRGYWSYANWLEPLGIIPTDEYKSCDMVLFAGGEDVSPEIYSNKIPHRSVSSNINRDEREQIIYNKALADKKPMLGICRGSQYLCVMANNLDEHSLVQHQSQPGFNHPMKCAEGGEITVTSTHHQSQWPFNLPENDYELLGWTENGCSQRWFNEEGKVKEVYPNLGHIEVEEVYYKKINALGLQHHPEYVFPPNNNQDSKYIERCQNLVKKYLISE